MKAVDLEQRIFVPVVDETHGGATFEIKMTVGEFFDKCCGGFRPEVVEAIPVEWLENARRATALVRTADAVGVVLELWRRRGNQEGR